MTEIIKVDTDKKTITVRREIEGAEQLVEANLPVLLTVELQLGAPRYASLPSLIKAIRQDIPVWGAKEIGAAPEELGLKGSPTSVRTIFAPPPRKGGPVFDSTEEFLHALFKSEPSLLDELLTKG